jgi:hypothetical protein
MTPSAFRAANPEQKLSRISSNAASVCASALTARRFLPLSELIQAHGFDPELDGGLLGETKGTAEVALGDEFVDLCQAGADLDLESAVERA